MSPDAPPDRHGDAAVVPAVPAVDVELATFTCLTHAVTLRLTLRDAHVLTELARGFSVAHAACELSVDRTIRLPEQRPRS